MHSESGLQSLSPKCRWGSGRNDTHGGAYSTPAGIARHVGQMEASMACLRFIQAHESSYGIKFQYVTRTRPDLGFLAPVRPHCFYFPTQPLAPAQQSAPLLAQQRAPPAQQQAPRVAFVDARDFIYVM